MSIKKAGFVFVLIVSVGILLSFYSEVLLAPNSYMFNQNGDAFKNYFSVFNHVNNTSGIMQTPNVNYPNGEMLMFMDGQFAVSNGIKFWSHFFPGIAHYTVGILNLLMLLSIPLCAVFLYQLLLIYKVEAQFAAVGALGLMLMQPQIFRLSGHFALGYAFVIPLSWLLFEKFRSTRSGFWLFMLVWANTTFFFIHPYFGLIVTLFELLIVFFGWFFMSNKAKKILNSVLQIFWLVIPIIIFTSVVTLLDFHEGRSNDPYGIFVYQASLQTIFLPELPPLNPIINKYIFSLNQNWEGWAYIGLANIFGIIALVFLLIKRRTRNLVMSHPQFKFFLPVLLTGWVLMLYSIGFPVNFLGYDFVESFPIIKQFRALGRFAWAFYYVTGVSTILLIQYFVPKEKIKFLLIGIVGLMMTIEGIPYHQATAKTLVQTKNLFVEEHSGNAVNDLVNHVEASVFQAILPLPFYMLGSDNMMVEGSSESAIISQTVSARKNLPIIGGMLSRTSLIETRETIKLLSPNFYPKPVLDGYLPNKPILITYTGQALSQEQESILKRATFLFTNSFGSLYSIYPEQFYTCPSDTLKDIKRSFSTFVKHPSCWVSDSTSFFFLSDYNKENSNQRLLGIGALQQLKKGYRELKVFKENTFEIGVEYELTVWFYNQGSGRVQEIIGMHYFTPEGENGGWIKYTDAKFCETVFGDWSLVRMAFKVDQPKNVVKVLVAGDKTNMDVYYDNLLIREKSLNVMQKTVFEGDTVIVFNNDIISFCK